MSLPTSSDNRGSRAFKTSSNSHCGSCSSRLGLEPNSFRRSAIRSQIRFDAAVMGRLLPRQDDGLYAAPTVGGLEFVLALFHSGRCCGSSELGFLPSAEIRTVQAREHHIRWF